MTFDDGVLNRLAPALPWKSDWADVLGRAGELDPRRRQPWARRRRILTFAVLAAILITLAAANIWWLFR
jgi:hypothetical protein